MKKHLLKKANTMPHKMMDEFLARQELYERIYKPPMKIEELDNTPPSKLREAVHQARERFVEFNKQKEVQSAV